MKRKYDFDAEDKFWIDKTSEIKERLRALIIGKLIEKEATNISDAELQRCLGDCVGAGKLIRFAKMMRFIRVLKKVDIRPLR